MNSSGPAAAVPPVTTFGDLSAAFAAGGAVVLGGEITETGQVLAVGAGKSVTLDLAGYDLSVTGVPAGRAGIGVPAGTTLTIEDSSDGDGELIATGGAGGAGIGGDAGTAGVSTFDPTGWAPDGASGTAGTVTGGNGSPGANGGPTGERGGNGGSGGAVAGTAALATGGNGARGGSGAVAANGGNGGAGGSSSTTGVGGIAIGGAGGVGGQGGVGSPGGTGGAGGAALSTSGVANGGNGGEGGEGGTGAGGGTGGATGVVSVLGGVVVATGGSGGAGIGGGVGGVAGAGSNGGAGGAGGAGTGVGGTGVGGVGGMGGDAGTGGTGGTGGAGGTVTISGAEVTAVGGTGAQDIGGGGGGAGGTGGLAGPSGANGASSVSGSHGASARRRAGSGSTGAVGASGTVFYGPGAPTAVTAQAGRDSAKVSFTAPASSGSNAITSYTVTATDVTDPLRGGQTGTGAGSPVTVNGLTTGDDYTFTVKATNGVGTGLRSAPSSAVTAEDSIVFPHSFTTGTSATISGLPRVGQVLTADAGDVFPAPDHYTYHWFADITEISGASSATFTPTGAELGKAITVEVSAVKAGYATSTDTSEATGPVARQAAALVVTAPTELQLAGTSAKITTLGLEAGEHYTIRIDGAQVATGTASGSGLLDSWVTLPALARDAHVAVTVTGSEPDRTGTTTASVLTNKTLPCRIKKARVPVGHRQTIRITGLADLERITIRYGGKRISAPDAHANPSGGYRLTFRVGKHRGLKTITATGQFPGRIATKTFRVTR